MLELALSGIALLCSLAAIALLENTLQQVRALRRTFKDRYLFTFCREV